MEKQKIVIASGNKGKIRELQSLLGAFNIETAPQSEFNVPDIEETGLTFIENAILKARNAAKLTGLPALADDSGLCVFALDNRPGIYSARYAGPGAKDTDLIAKVLAEMKDVPDEQRGAAFHSVIAYLRHEADPDPIIAHGVWPGSIVHHAEGEHGFGYDPIFFVPEHNCTAAELDADVKNKISHRGRALAALQEQWTAEHSEENNVLG
jgi:XTP/dITP diphosphohydrolase